MDNLWRTVAIAAAVSICVATQAAAHAHLKSATPAIDGSVATSPKELDLVFSTPVILKNTGVRLRRADRSRLPIGEARLSSENILVVPVTVTLPPGYYTVEWFASSADDGHRPQGRYNLDIGP